jgi:hypothetical protein
MDLALKTLGWNCCRPIPSCFTLTCVWTQSDEGSSGDAPGSKQVVESLSWWSRDSTRAALGVLEEENLQVITGYAAFYGFGAPFSIITDFHRRPASLLLGHDRGPVRLGSPPGRCPSRGLPKGTLGQDGARMGNDCCGGRAIHRGGPRPARFCPAQFTDHRGRRVLGCRLRPGRAMPKGRTGPLIP